jgi:hypothetical protein
MSAPTTIALPHAPHCRVPTQAAAALALRKSRKRAPACYDLDGQSYRVYLPPAGYGSQGLYLVELDAAPTAIMIGTVDHQPNGWATHPLIIGAEALTGLPSIRAAIRALYPPASDAEVAA